MSSSSATRMKAPLITVEAVCKKNAARSAITDPPKPVAIPPLSGCLSCLACGVYVFVGREAIPEVVTPAAVSTLAKFARPGEIDSSALHDREGARSMGRLLSGRKCTRETTCRLLWPTDCGHAGRLRHGRPQRDAPRCRRCAVPRRRCAKPRPWRHADAPRLRRLRPPGPPAR